MISAIANFAPATNYDEVCAVIRCPLRGSSLPGSNRAILGAKELHLIPQQVARCPEKRSLNEKPRKCCQNRVKAPPDVSVCRLNNLRLINWLGVLITETHWVIKSPRCSYRPKFLQSYREAS